MKVVEVSMLLTAESHGSPEICRGNSSNNSLILFSPEMFSSGPHRIRWRQMLQPQPRCIYGTGAGIDKYVVQERAECTAQKRCNHWDLISMSACNVATRKAEEPYPKVVSARTPHFVAVANSIRHEPGAEISSNIDGVAGFPPETRSEAKDEEEEAQREPFVALHYCQLRF